MVTVYKTAFNLGGTDVVPSLDSIINTLHSWAKEKLGNLDRSEFSSGTELEKDKLKLSTIRTKDSQSDYFGLQLIADEKPDLWEVNFALKSEKHDHLVSVFLDRSRTDGIVTPIQDLFQAPSLVPLLINKFGGVADYPLYLNPTKINEKTVDLFLDRLFSENRKLPFVLLSPGYRSFCFASPEKIANEVHGIAHVYYTKNRLVSDMVNKSLPFNLKCINGTVRIYWPSINANNSSDTVHTYHNAWLPRSFLENRPLMDNISKEILKVIADNSVHVKLPISYRDVQMLKMREQIADIQKQGSQMTEEKTLWLLEQNINLESLVKKQDEEIAKLQGKVYSLEQTNRSILKKSVVPELSQEERDSAIESKLNSISSVKEALTLFEKEHPGSLLWYDTSIRKAALNSTYHDPKGVYLAFAWLTSSYSQSKQGNSIGTSLEQSCKVSCGMDYAPHQSDTTMGKFRREYELKYRGETVMLEEHLKKGTSKDELSSLRIAVFWDPIEKKTVVGYFGAHQRNKS